MEIPEIEFTDSQNQSLLSDLSRKMKDINREKSYEKLIREVDRPYLRDGMTRIVSSENLETLRELGKIYGTVGWVPSSLVITKLDKFEIELTFDQSKSPFNL